MISFFFVFYLFSFFYFIIWFFFIDLCGFLYFFPIGLSQSQDLDHRLTEIDLSLIYHLSYRFVMLTGLTRAEFFGSFFLSNFILLYLFGWELSYIVFSIFFKKAVFSPSYHDYFFKFFNLIHLLSLFILLIIKIKPTYLTHLGLQLEWKIFLPSLKPTYLTHLGLNSTKWGLIPSLENYQIVTELSTKYFMLVSFYYSSDGNYLLKIPYVIIDGIFFHR